MHSRVMTWQSTTQVMHRAPTPPPRAWDVSEDIQVELVLSEHSGEQVELKAILSFAIICNFQNFGFIENKRTLFKLLIFCVVILNQV